MLAGQIELYIGITSWNSELFLRHCLESIKERTYGIEKAICVLDNNSTDNSVIIAEELGTAVISQRCSQAEALNILAAQSNGFYTLLLHADVILLSDSWFQECVGKFVDSRMCLISPEDIGCGPLTRSFGMHMPESSFLFFQTDKMRKLTCRRWERRHKVPCWRNKIDFFGKHITHNLPKRIQKRGYTWFPMRVDPSDMMTEPVYTPKRTPEIWSRDLEFLRYGLGNFYSIDGVITHYHNWYDRVQTNLMGTLENSNATRSSFPPEYIESYTKRFLSDYRHQRIKLPDVTLPKKLPRAL